MADQDIKHYITNRYGEKGLSDKQSSPQPANSAPQPIQEECQVTIDLRNVYPNSCSPIYHGNQIHYLDRDSGEYFLGLLEKNDGYYTERIYQSVLKYAATNLPVEVEEEESELNRPPVVIPAGYSQNRQESRLNYKTDVEIELPSGFVTMARSVDISASGIQLRIPQILDVINEMEVLLSFPSIEQLQEKQFGQIPYVLKKHEVGSLHMSLFLVRKDPGSKNFDIFIEDFIKRKKHRYRLDSEDSNLALFSKAWEYVYIKSLPYIACFISTARERIQIQDVCVSISNARQLQGLGQAMLSHLENNLSYFRINGIAQNETRAPEIYAFRKDGGGIKRRLCAASWQFNETTERLDFLKEGIKSPSFRAWRVNVVKLEDLPKSRSRELLARLQESSIEQADNLVAQLNQSHYLLYLTDITTRMRYDPLLTTAEDDEPIPDHFFDPYELGHHKTSDFTRLRLGIGKRRNEHRYIYRSPVIMKLYGDKIKGETLDFSVNGLKVKTTKSNQFQIRDTVYLEFTGFNKKFRSAKLKSEPYRVVAITGDGAICLCRDHRVSQHKAAIFLRKLIDKNAEILQHCTGDLWMSTKARLIEAWMHQCLPAQSLLVARTKNRYHVPYIIHSHTTAALLKPFALGEDLYNFNSLFERKELNSLFRHLKIEQEHTVCLETYVTKTGPTAEDIIVKFWDDFDSDLARAEYLRVQVESAYFIAYEISLSKIPKLDKSDMREDITVIWHNSRHRLIEFEETYKSLVGVVELVDITTQIQKRYNLDDRKLK